MSIIHNTTKDYIDRPTFNGFQDINETNISPKARTLDYYMYLLEPYFDRFEIYSSDGELRPAYKYQWHALAKPFEFDDDAYSGIGATPLEAIRNLYNSMKRGQQS